MHNFLFLGIPAKEIKNGFNYDDIEIYVNKVMSKYVTDTADEENVKCDYCQIGGRWQGVLAAKKDSKNVILTETGMFEENYDFFQVYNALENNGENGPYVIDDVEYVPVNGGLMSDIGLDFISRFRHFEMYAYSKHIMEKDPRLGETPDYCRIADDGLYCMTETGEENLMYKKDESFAQFAERMEIEFMPDFIPPHAYVDLDGVWHDENEVWDNIEAELLSGKFPAEDVMDDAGQKFAEAAYEFIKGLAPEDGLVVVDYHI